jgi:hypothetical protein
MAPNRPSSAISRSTVHLATGMPSRFSANDTLRAPVDAVVGGVDPRDLVLQVLVASSFRADNGMAEAWA